MFDENHDGLIGKIEFGNVIRALGENPSLKDIDDLFDKASLSNGQIGLDVFLSEVGPRLAAKDFSTEQVIEMFRVVGFYCNFSTGFKIQRSNSSG